MDELVDEILEHLFEGYTTHGGTPIFDVTAIILRHAEDPQAVGRFLVDRGLVKFERFGPLGFSASISMQGIYRIRPGYITDNVMHVLRTLDEHRDQHMSMMQILQFEPKDFQIAHNFATYMRDRGWINAVFTHNDIGAKITLEGRDHLNNG
jgi:hypothetical protein